MSVPKKMLAILLAALLAFAFAGCRELNNLTSGGSSEPEDSATASGRTEETTATSNALTLGFDVGNVMPDFSVPLVGGGTFTLSENRGKPVFINLFATWCGWCVKEMPEIDELYLEYTDSVAFIVLDVDGSESEAVVQGFADKGGYSVPFAYSPDGLPFGSAYYADYLPQTFVLNGQGVIVEFFGGASDYDSFKAAIEAAQ